MTREIIVRAWNGEEMYNPNTIYIQNGCITGERNETLMQYIGIKDSNGKEIYEGDIVEYTHPEKSPHREEYSRVNGDIRFYTSEKFGNHAEFNVFPKHATDRGLNVWTMYKHVTPEGPVVIGNIYENEDLLDTY